MRRAAKIDSNQNEIVEGLRKCGYSVAVTSSLGKGFPDIVVGARGKNILLELKDGKKPPSKRILTPDEIEWHEKWRGQVHTVESLDEAIILIQNL